MSSIIRKILESPKSLRLAKVAVLATLAALLLVSCIAKPPTPPPPASEMGAPATMPIVEDSGLSVAQQWAEAYVAGNVEGAVAISSPRVAEDLRDAPTVDPALEIVQSATILLDGPSQQTYHVKLNKFGLQLTTAKDGNGKWIVDSVEVKR